MLIYVVEDEPQQRDFFTKSLQAEQHDVVAFPDTIAAHNYFVTHPTPDAVLIDFRFVGGPNGLSLARQVHAIHPATAVVMTSNFADKDDIIEAFRAGIDDFLLKPVEAKMLVQCLGNAVIERRTKHPPDLADRFLGDLRVDPVSRQAWWKGQPLPLTKTQYTLLLQLTAKPGRWFNYAELYAACTGDHIDPAQAGHKLKTHVHNLRQRLKEVDPSSYCPIVSRRGDGLSWRVEPDAGR